MNTCWLDFWTSNSTMSYRDKFWKIHLVNLGKWKPETRTVLFWDNEEWRAVIGDEWIQRFIEWSPWRLIQSPKSFLNSKEEISTMYWWEKRDLGNIITSIIFDFRRRFQEITNQEALTVRLWRPVKFHDTNDLLDKLAQTRLEQYAKNAGFKNVEFEFEPLAAAKTFENPESLEGKSLLVADFWWWTSDFSIVNFSKNRHMQVLWNSWVYIAGNSFDQKLSLGYFSKFLWNWTQFRSGEKLFEMPSQPYFLLSDWKNIHHLNDKKVKQWILDIRGALDQDALSRLIEITSNPELGYEYFRMVEQAKIATSSHDPIEWHVSFFKKAFDYILTRDQFKQITAEQVEKIRKALKDAMKQSGTKAEDIGKILLVGWTWQLFLIKEMLEQEVWTWKTIEGNTFNAIGTGLSM